MQEARREVDEGKARVRELEKATDKATTDAEVEPSPCYPTQHVSCVPSMDDAHRCFLVCLAIQAQISLVEARLKVAEGFLLQKEDKITRLQAQLGEQHEASLVLHKQGAQGQALQELLAAATQQARERGESLDKANAEVFKLQEMSAAALAAKEETVAAEAKLAALQQDTARLAVVEEELAFGEARRIELEAEIGELQATKGQLESRLRLADLVRNQEKDELKSSQSSLYEELTAVQAYQAATQKELEAVQQSNIELEALVQELESVEESSKQARERLQESLDLQTAELEAAVDACRRLTETQGVEKASMAQAHATAEEVMATVGAQLRDELAAAKAECDRIGAAAASKSVADCEAAEREVKELTAEHRRAMAAAKKEIEGLQGQVAATKDSMRKQGERRVGEVREELVAAQVKTAAAEQRLQKHEQAAQAELEALQAQMAYLTDEIHPPSAHTPPSELTLQRPPTPARPQDAPNPSPTPQYHPSQLKNQVQGRFERSKSLPEELASHP